VYQTEYRAEILEACVQPWWIHYSMEGWIHQKKWKVGAIREGHEGYVCSWLGMGK
jgi:hypothetical protein